MRNTRRTVALTVLLLLHLGVLAAGFLVPYDPAEQDRGLPWAPPSRIRFIDSAGRIHFRPFVYVQIPDRESGGYVESHSQRYPLRFLVHGASYSVFGLFDSDLHLVGVAPPARLSLLGRDDLGRDVFSRLVVGGRISLATGLLAAVVTLSLGVVLGSLSGYFGGRIDDLLMRFSELFMALPWLYLLLAIRALLPRSISSQETFFLLIFLLGAVGWARPARLVRGVVLSVRNSPYIEAARGLGAHTARVIGLHVLPQTRQVVFTQAALLIPQYILAEVTLSFLGLGISEPTPSWGTMLKTAQGHAVIAVPYWWMLSPAVALMFLFVAYHQLARSFQTSPE